MGGSAGSASEATSPHQAGCRKDQVFTVRTGARDNIEPTCPFCKTSIERPAEIAIDASDKALGGKCRKCGAWYIVDQTGKNVGTVMMQALELAGRELSKEATSLVSGEDYDDAVLNYDLRTHRSTGESKGHMDGRGRLYMIKVRGKKG